jgi:hypothetical protein
MALVALLALMAGPPAAADPTPPAKSIVNTAALAFGRFAAAGGGGVSVDPNGVRTRSGAVVLLMSTPSPARYIIGSMGNDNRIYILTLPPNGSVVLSSGAQTMALNNFVSSLPPGGLLPGAAQNISVGATLQVAPGQRPGNYSGAFQVTLEYQ